jgi:hypothetical protein
VRILTATFLEALFPDPGYIELRAMRGAEVKRDFAAGSAGALAFFYKVKASHDLYFGVAARSGCHSGGKHDLACSRALWVDIDLADARQQLEASVLPQPSIVVASGSPGHLQAYWLLNQAFDLHTAEAVARFESHLRGIAAACGGDRACVDACRVLRLPNSRNFKRQPPAYVDILEWRPELRYRLEDFPRGEDVSIEAVLLGEAVLPDREVTTPWLKRILEQGYEGQRNPNRSRVDFKAAARLLEEGFTPEEALGLCLASPAIGHRKPHAEAYWRRTIGSALKRVA